MKLISTLIILFLILGSQVDANASTCGDIFLRSENVSFKSKSLANGFFPKILRARLKSTITKLSRKDSRLLAVKLAGLSKTFDRLDNLTSPATLNTIIFSRSADPAKIVILRKDQIVEPRLVSILLHEMGYEIPENIRAVIDIVEERYYSGLNILLLARKQKGVLLETINPERYVDLLLENISSTIQEIAETSGDLSWTDALRKIANADWDRVRLELVQRKSVEQKNIDFNNTNEVSIFQDSFLNMIDVQREPLEDFKSVSRLLEKELGAMTVGLSYKILELTTTVRFGSKHFYGHWFTYKTVERPAFLKNATLRGGVYEIDLKITNQKKKMIAVLLDRSHRQLDPLFSPDKQTPRCFYTCGAYAPILLMRAGVRVVSPAYIAPSPVLLSLTLQKYFGLGPAGETRMINPEPGKGPMMLPTVTSKELKVSENFLVPVIVLHEAVGMTIDLSFYLLTYSMLGSALQALF